MKEMQGLWGKFRRYVAGNDLPSLQPNQPDLDSEKPTEKRRAHEHDGLNTVALQGTLDPRRGKEGEIIVGLEPFRLKPNQQETQPQTQQGPNK